MAHVEAARIDGVTGRIHVTDGGVQHRPGVCHRSQGRVKIPAVMAIITVAVVTLVVGVTAMVLVAWLRAAVTAVLVAMIVLVRRTVAGLLLMVAVIVGLLIAVVIVVTRRALLLRTAVVVGMLVVMVVLVVVARRTVIVTAVGARQGADHISQATEDTAVSKKGHFPILCWLGATAPDAVIVTVRKTIDWMQGEKIIFFR